MLVTDYWLFWFSPLPLLSLFFDFFVVVDVCIARLRHISMLMPLFFMMPPLHATSWCLRGWFFAQRRYAGCRGAASAAAPLAPLRYALMPRSMLLMPRYITPALPISPTPMPLLSFRFMFWGWCHWWFLLMPLPFSLADGRFHSRFRCRRWYYYASFIAAFFALLRWWPMALILSISRWLFLLHFFIDWLSLPLIFFAFISFLSRHWRHYLIFFHYGCCHTTILLAMLIRHLMLLFRWLRLFSCCCFHFAIDYFFICRHADFFFFISLIAFDTPDYFCFFALFFFFLSEAITRVTPDVLSPLTTLISDCCFLSLPLADYY